MGLPLPTLIRFGTTVRISVTDPDFKFSEFDWKSFHYTWSAANGGLRDGGLSKSEDIRGKRPFSSVFWIFQVLFGPSGKGRKKAEKGRKTSEKGRLQPISRKGGQTPLKPPFVTPPLRQPNTHSSFERLLVRGSFWASFGDRLAIVWMVEQQNDRQRICQTHLWATAHQKKRRSRGPALCLSHTGVNFHELFSVIPCLCDYWTDLFPDWIAGAKKDP